MTEGFATFGTVIQMGDGASPEVFTAIAEVQDITPPEISVEDIEVTHQTSTDGYGEYIPGLKEGGEVSFDCNFLPANATHGTSTGLMAKIGVLANWRIVYPTAVDYRWSFRGYLKQISPKAPLKGKSEANITIKVTGKPTLETVP